MIPPAGCTILQRSRCPHGEGSTSGTSHRHSQHLLYRFLPGSRAETPQGSQPACASGDVATRIRPITGRPSLFPTPLPAPPSVGLTTSLPSLRRSDTGLPRSTRLTRMGEVLSSPPGALGVHDRVYRDPVPAPVPFGASLSASLACSSRCYRKFTCVHPTMHPAPSPPDAGRSTVPSRFRCQSGDCGYRVRRLCTGRYLPAHLRRILLMEQQVWSRHARQ